MSDVMLCGVLRMPFDDQGDTHLVQLRDCCRQAANELEKRAAMLAEAAAFLEGLAGRIKNWPPGASRYQFEPTAAECRAMVRKLRGETMPHFYDYQGNAICEACSEQIPDGERDGPHYVHWFQCQECKREFDCDGEEG